jgi:hypothetical protein
MYPSIKLKYEKNGKNPKYCSDLERPRKMSRKVNPVNTYIKYDNPDFINNLFMLNV